MPFIEHAISTINNSIKTTLQDVRFAGSKMFGLSRLVPSDGTTIPSIVDSSGNGEFTGFDSRYPLVSYHRAVGMTEVELQSNQSFGDGDTQHIQVYRMRCVVYADRNIVKMNPENLASMVQNAIRKDWKGDVDGLTSVSTNTFSCDLDPVRVFVEEYSLPAQQYRIPITGAYFAINYNLNIEYNTTCIDYCDPCSN